MGAVGCEGVVVSVEDSDVARDEERIHGGGLLDVGPDGEEALPVCAAGGGAGTVVVQAGGGDLDGFDDGGWSDAGLVHGGGRGDDGNNFYWVAGLDGSRGGSEVEWEDLIDGEVLRGEDAVEAFEREGALAVEEVGDVGLQLIGSMGYCRITQIGSAWVVSTLPSGVKMTRLIGVAGEGVDCKVSSAGKVTFFAGRIPVAGELVTVTYRIQQRAVARLQNTASVTAEAAGGMPGTARWLGSVLKPEARSSLDCESAALAVLSFATSRAAAAAGTYVAVNPADVWPGDVLAITSGGQTMNMVVRRVEIVNGMTCPEMLTYSMAFANDWAEGLGLTLSETIAANALLPQTALSAPGNVLANLQQLQMVSATGTALQVDAGTAPPAGGGFEVRRRDGDFGPRVDQDLVLRSPVRSFSIPREGQVEHYYVRMYDGSTPPLYSRFSSAVFTDLPVSE
jgi:hypothetical protein